MLIIVRGDTRWNILNIYKPNVNNPINGVLPIVNGGKVASTSEGAVSNLGITFATGHGFLF